MIKTHGIIINGSQKFTNNPKKGLISYVTDELYIYNIDTKEWNQVTNYKNVLYIDNKSQNSPGGTFSSGSWRTRQINTEIISHTWSILKDNQITLNPGKYFIEISCPACGVFSHMCRFTSITGDDITLYGTSEVCKFSSNAIIQTRSYIKNEIEISNITTFEIQHYCTTTKATYGMGYPCNIDNTNETYTIVNIIKKG